MKEQLDLILSNAKSDILGASNLKELNDVKVKYQGKNGEVTKLMQGMRDIPKEDRPAFGKIVNEYKERAEAKIDLVMSSIMALSRAIQAEESAPTIFFL